MFIQAVIISIIIGYILKGKINNLENVNVKGGLLAAVAFGLEFTVIILIRKGILTNGTLTYLLDLSMYILLGVFVYLNRKDSFVLLMGIGFLLNAVPILLNGGAMPVSAKAYTAVGLKSEVTKEGLYCFINGNTRFWFLGDIIPYKFISKLVISIGDIVIAIGLMLFIITGMRKKSS